MKTSVHETLSSLLNANRMLTLTIRYFIYDNHKTFSRNSIANVDSVAFTAGIRSCDSFTLFMSMIIDWACHKWQFGHVLASNEYFQIYDGQLNFQSECFVCFGRILAPSSMTMIHFTVYYMSAAKCLIVFNNAQRTYFSLLYTTASQYPIS